MKETDRERRGEQEQFGPCGKHPRKIAETPSQAWYRAYESEIADKDPAQHCPECDRLALARTPAEGAAQDGNPLREWVKRHSCDPNISVALWNELSALAESLNSRREPAGASQQDKRMDILLDENCIATIKRLTPSGGEEISFGGVMGGGLLWNQPTKDELRNAVANTQSAGASLEELRIRLDEQTNHNMATASGWRQRVTELESALSKLAGAAPVTAQKKEGDYVG